MEYNCLTHGLISGAPRRNGEPYCPSCEAEANPPAAPITPEQEAVIAAAQDALYDMRERGYDHRWELSNEKYHKLDKTIRNLQALHAPKPVRPEDCQPGTWFRFADGAKDHKSCLLPVCCFKACLSGYHPR